MSGSDQQFRNDRRREAGRWLAVALADMRAVRLCLGADQPERGIAAYHCQQAAEKLVKGLLVVADTPFAKTHDMAQLGDLAASRYPDVRELFAEIGRLTVWGFAYRYPALEATTEPSLSVLQETLGTVERIAAYLRSLGVSEPGAESRG